MYSFGSCSGSIPSVVGDTLENKTNKIPSPSSAYDLMCSMQKDKLIFISLKLLTSFKGLSKPRLVSAQNS